MKITKSILRYFLLAVMLFTGMTLLAAEKDSEFVVVIDPGHGGHDTGAIDNGVKEKDINLAVAKRLQEDIHKKLKGVKVVMTRSNDSFVTLQGRADIANRNKADLFISIHTNSVDAKNPNRKTVAGTSVYALGLHKDKDNLNVAKRENAVIELEQNHEQKYSGFDPSKDESYIIFEMAQKKNLEQSLKFANYAQKQLVSHALRKDRGVKQAGFWVLWATSMPAVLVELDFICNPTSAQFMGSSEGVKKMAESLCSAVEQYYNSVKNSNGVGKRVSLNSKTKGSSQNVAQKSVASTSKSASAVSSHSNTVQSSEDNRGELVGQSKAKRTDTPPTITKSSANTRGVTTARKRRSTSSKLASEKRNVSTSSIVVKSEKDYLAKSSDKKPVVKQEKPTPVKETPKERKKRLALEKKNKEKERKEKEAVRKKEAKAKEEALKKKRKEAQKKTNNNNNSKKKVVVNKSASSSSTKSRDNKSSSSIQVKKRKSLNSKSK
ncbi:MAG: N-acetylmuramoyl-L-alanine amidase [Bacteroides sp.]|nr:N-acetylmuramoyl-L-alanine amidase [Bacteroides sp.]